MNKTFAVLMPTMLQSIVTFIILHSMYIVWCVSRKSMNVFSSTLSSLEAAHLRYELRISRQLIGEFSRRAIILQQNSDKPG